MSEKQMSIPGIAEVTANATFLGPRPPRPSIHDAELRERWLGIAAESLHASGAFDDMDIDEIKETLVKARIRPGQDGYEAAKDFERASYSDLNFEAAEALENLDSGYLIEKNALEEWVKAYSVQPKLAVGDQFKHRNDRMVVISHYESVAKYACYVLAEDETIPAEMTPLEIFAKYHTGGPGNKTKSLRILTYEAAESSL